MSENNKVSDKTLDYMIHDANLQYLAAGFPDLCSHWQDRIDALTELKSLRAENERLGADAYKDELLKIAADVGEPDDPFAAWEAIAALKAKLEEVAKVLERVAEDQVHTAFGPKPTASAKAASAFLANLKGAE